MAKGVRFGGYWEDGTPKYVGANGQVLPKGTTFTISGKKVMVGKPVTSLTDLPSGSYDPGLLYQSQNANLGLLYNNQDFTTDWNGWQTDANGNPVRPTDLSTAGRGIADYFKNVDRENADYTTATNDLNHNYQVLGNNQLQGINAAGELSGGALAQALAKRTANQARDQSRLDTTHGRTLSDLLTGTTRAHADASVGLGRATDANALFQGGLYGTATAQANQSGMLVDNPNYETHNGVIYSVTQSGEVKPVSTVKPVGNGTGGSPYKPTHPGKAPNPNNVFGKPGKRGSAKGTGGTVAP